ncbi:prepilin-type N-terminal cleavage/methylation domain-containing protein [Nodosilinea sp. LEGE 07298]|uniref:pilus assembly FimT family protein n=1 Tax=Nodosilinea sp. LEGE 07298 TaxID=2777970 RepID=UPI00187FE857|nr:prepilin-type N-terminal cleavage/methylation domain-containing protein [Nodosilinea sp. LEGE 07298]MBE9112201.1 prepilin-type N-terminal cleavage/methylation domain-containing protein [Nodosilinea sp. LEGE 07298]
MKHFAFRRTNQTAGFTLIEVLVVVIIAGILAAIAAPGWLAFLSRQRVSAVESDLIQTLKNAQQDAIQRRITFPVQINDGAASPTVVVNGLEQSLGDSGDNPGNIQLRSYVVADGDQDDDFDTIVFDYRGMPTVGTSPADGTVIDPEDASSEDLPFVISIRAGNGGVQQCVIVANLLGSLKTANNAECEDPNVATD